MEVSVLPKISAEQLSGIRAEFPILQQKVNNHALVYLDNGATTQKPLSVINAVSDHYKKNNSNIHRGVHSLSQRSTEAYEQAREKVREHINASKTSEVIFTKGTTESINLVAHALGRKVVGKGDEVLVTMMEHHSNILPWQRLCEENGALLKVVNILEDGQLDLDDFKKKLNKSTKIVAFTHVSNTLGTINPVKELVHSVKEVGAYCVVDGAQAIPHMKVDVQELNCDFYCFSGHKAYAPSGIGVLFSKESLLQKMDLYQTGGGTIKTVSFESTEYAESPLKYEAGTPPIEAAIGLGAALDFINAIGIEAISKHENELLEKATQALSSIDGYYYYYY